MPNLALILKSEIARIARKELRAQVPTLKKSLAELRSDVAELKRRNKALETALGRMVRSGAARVQAPANEAEAETEGSGLRFSAKGLASQRARLGLSAQECGLLVGASGQSIYKWEAGKARPRARQLPALAALRGMGKKQARARLAELSGG